MFNIIIMVMNFSDLNKVHELAMESLIIDEESCSSLRHLVPRVEGGGRALGTKYNYKCIWCPKEKLKHSTQGRFSEFR